MEQFDFTQNLKEAVYFMLFILWEAIFENLTRTAYIESKIVNGKHKSYQYIWKERNIAQSQKGYKLAS